VDSLRAFFESLAIEWDAQQPSNRGEVLRQILVPFDAELRAANAILEVGTGTGALIPQLRARAPAAHLVSIDLAEAMLQRARKRCPDASLIQCDVHRLPFSSVSIGLGAFDLVICHNSFPHFVEPPVAIAEFVRVLRRDGCLLIMHDMGRDQVNAIHRESHTSVIHNDLLPPGEELAKMLENVGFEIINYEDSESRYIMHACQHDNTRKDRR